MTVSTRSYWRRQKMVDTSDLHRPYLGGDRAAIATLPDT